jgi:addiction module RelE/StbE family toxin
MKVIWRPVAIADRVHIFNYIDPNNPRAARELDDQFKAKAEIAARNPRLYRPGRLRGTREIVVGSYIMIYRIDAKADAIVMLRVIHGARQWPSAPMVKK